MNREIRGITSLFRAALEAQQNRAAKEIKLIENFTRKQNKAEEPPEYVNNFLESATRWTLARFQSNPNYHSFTGYIDRSIIPYILALQFVTHNYKAQEQEEIKAKVVKTCVRKTFHLSNQLLRTMVHADDAMPLSFSEISTHIVRAQNLASLVVPENLKKYYEYINQEEQFEFERIFKRLASQNAFNF